MPTTATPLPAKYDPFFAITNELRRGRLRGSFFAGHGGSP